MSLDTKRRTRSLVLLLLAIRRANCCAFDPFDPETVVIGTYGAGS